MKKYKVGVVRVLTTEDPDMLNKHGRLLEKYYPMFETESRCIPDQYEGIHDDATIASGTPKVIRLIEEFERDGFDACIVSCAEDPGVREARKKVKIPVVGAGESVSALSLILGEHPGELGITEMSLSPYTRILGERKAGTTKGSKVESTLSLLTEEGYTSTVEAAESLKNKGADAIALSCTGMSTIGIAPKLEADLGIPVIDPVLSEGAVALFMLIKKELSEQED